MGTRKSDAKVDAEEFLQVFLSVRGGTLTAKAAARQLGISRKTYYEWEARAFQGLMEALPRLREGCRPARMRMHDAADMWERIVERTMRLRIRGRIELSLNFFSCEVYNDHILRAHLIVINTRRLDDKKSGFVVDA